jgi:hypothetical protein
MSRVLAPFILLAVVGLGGCTSGTRPSRDPLAGPTARSEASGLRLIVGNRQFNDASLYATGSGGRVPLGVVPGSSRREFTIPWRSRGALQVEIEVLSVGRFLTPPVSVAPGETVQLIVEVRLRDSRLRN